MEVAGFTEHERKTLPAWYDEWKETSTLRRCVGVVTARVGGSSYAYVQARVCFVGMCRKYDSVPYQTRALLRGHVNLQYWFSTCLSLTTGRPAPRFEHANNFSSLSAMLVRHLRTGWFSLTQPVGTASWSLKNLKSIFCFRSQRHIGVLLLSDDTYSVHSDKTPYLSIYDLLLAKKVVVFSIYTSAPFLLIKLQSLELPFAVVCCRSI